MWSSNCGKPHWLNKRDVCSGDGGGFADSGTKYCDQHVCVSIFLFIYPSVCLLAYLKHHLSKFKEIFFTCCCGHGSVLLWWQRCSTLCTSGFVNDVTFLPRDAMLAHFMLLSCVCPSHAGIVPKRLNRIAQTIPYDSPGTLEFRRDL